MTPKLPLSFVVTILVIGSAQSFVPQATCSRKVYLQAIRDATFGMGCFWKPSEELLKVPGVMDTVVGYTGKPNATTAPNYESVCFSPDWVEGVRVQYDDEVISYSQLLDAFFEAQEPNVGSRQYGSYIFPHDSEQRATAQEWLSNNQDRVRNDGVAARLTQIETLSSFWKAENYHQRYWQKMRPRIAAWLALTAVGSGALDQFIPLDMTSSIHTAANAIVLAGLLFLLLERKIDANVVQL